MPATGGVITSGPQIMIYPGPRIQNLLVRKLDAAAVRRGAHRPRTEAGISS